MNINEELVDTLLDRMSEFIVDTVIETVEHMLGEDDCEDENNYCENCTECENCSACNLLDDYNHFALNVPIANMIDHVMYSKPATIVFWIDGTKTVVKSTGSDVFSKETGVALAILKKMFGDNYYRQLTRIVKHMSIDAEDINKSKAKEKPKPKAVKTTKTKTATAENTEKITNNK